jgi:hypothetical protein
MSTDGSSQLEAMWDSLAAMVLNVYDAYGWIVPALLLSVLFLGLIALFAWLTEELPLDLEIFRCLGGIFKWMRMDA